LNSCLTGIIARVNTKFWQFSLFVSQISIYTFIFNKLCF